MRIVPFLVPSAVALFGLASLSPWNHGRHAHGVAVARIEEPRTLLRMLSTQEQLEEAARRAATFERAVAARANERVAEYEALATSARPGDTTVHSLSNGANDDERRSA